MFEFTELFLLRRFKAVLEFLTSFIVTSLMLLSQLILPLLCTSLSGRIFITIASNVAI